VVRHNLSRPENRVGLQRLATDAVLQRHALQILHRYKRLTILLPDFVDRADVRMVQTRCSLCFSSKSLQGLTVLG